MRFARMCSGASATCWARPRATRQCSSIWITGRTSTPTRPERARPARAARAAARRSEAPPRPPRGLNENYARELLELHTLGVDGGYTQADVIAVARAFTGWTMQPREGSGFRFAAALHDEGAKTVLGQSLAAGRGIDDGEQVLDILAAHPATARRVATRLAQRFVSDTPPAALVERAAARFLATGGDLREVVRVIVTSPEFFAPVTWNAKLKTPFEFVASALRATGADVRTARPLRAHAARAGHAALLLPAADRLRRHLQHVGRLGGTGRPRELRGGTRAQPRARRPPAG